MVEYKKNELDDCVVIRPFQSSDQSAAKQLILDGLEEHWGYLDVTLNPDLNNIAETYQQETFLLAEMGNRIVGTGALIHENNGLARIVRMSVDKNIRRQGIGRKILMALIGAAKERGYHQITLETTATWQDALTFYKQNGFQVIETRAGDTHFLLNLGNRPESLYQKFA